MVRLRVRLGKCKVMAGKVMGKVWLGLGRVRVR